MMPQRSKTDWNLCSYSSISSVTWLCQHLSTVLPNKLLAASFQVFTFTGNNFSSLLLLEVMLACIKIWSKDLWSSDLSVSYAGIICCLLSHAGPLIGKLREQHSAVSPENSFQIYHHALWPDLIFSVRHVSSLYLFYFWPWCLQLSF